MFPAHAGMNRDRCNGIASGVGVPRTRGDEPFYSIKSIGIL